MGCVSDKPKSIPNYPPANQSQPIRTTQIVSNKQGQKELLQSISKLIQSQLRKQRTQKQIKNPLEMQEIKREDIVGIFDQSQSVQVFIQNLQEKVSTIYIDLSAKTLKGMNEKQFIQNESKVFISQQILWNNLVIMKFIGQRLNHKFDQRMFKGLNKVQKNLLGYLKLKYPRGTNLFVSDELYKMFKKFNMVEHPRNDILKNAKYYFGNQNREQLLKDIKKFFNLLIDQIDSKFPEFQNLLIQRVFTIPNGDEKILLNSKIGRKLPQNIARFDPNSKHFQIRSPEVLRVIIKWVEYLQQYIFQPQAIFQGKDYLKVIEMGENGQFIIDIISRAEDDQQIYIKIKKLLKQQKDLYNAKISQIQIQIDKFNSNLIKIMDQRERQQKYVPLKDADLIKYATLNTHLLQWNLAQKLMILMETLISVGKTKLKSQKVDLISFNVTDLLRAMVFCSKTQIIQVYDNLTKLQDQKKIKIVKIKNRLDTALNDLMVIFRFRGCFLLCQLQLVLTQKSNIEDSVKVKNIQNLNHFLYELERSPYGVQSELAAVLGYKDNRTKYESQIKYLKTQNIKFSKCEQTHPSKIKEVVQKMPIICTICTKFYRQFTNSFKIKICQECNHYICSRCLLGSKSGQKDYKKQLIKDLSMKFFQQKRLLKKRYNRSTKMKNQNFINQILDFNSLTRLIEIPDAVNSIISNKKLANFITQKMTNDKWSKYILLVRYNDEEDQIYIQNFQVNKNKLQYCFQIDEDYMSQADIYFGINDFIIPFKEKSTSKEYTIELLQTSESIQIFNLFEPEIERNYDKAKYFYLKVAQAQQKQPGQINILMALQYQSEKKQYKNFPSIEESRKKLPKISSTRQIYQLANCGINDQLLTYFNGIEWKLEVREINLTNNFITSVDVIFQNLLYLDKLYLKKNSITKVKIQQQMKKLSILNLSYNQISELVGINYLVALTKLDISSNNLQELEDMDLPKLQNLNINFLNLKSIKMLENSKLPNLKKIYMNSSFNYVAESDQAEMEKLITLQFPKLKHFELGQTFLKKNLRIQASNLEVLTLESLNMNQIFMSVSYITKVTIKGFTCKKLSNIELYQNFTILEDIEIEESQIGNFKQFFVVQSPYLKTIKAQNLSGFSKQQEQGVLDCFEYGYFPDLQKINISSCQVNMDNFINFSLGNVRQIVILSCDVKSIQSFSEQNLQNLTHLNLQSNLLTRIYPLRLDKLTYANFGRNQIENIESFSEWKAPLLQTLILQENQIKQFTQVKFESLKLLNIKFNPLQNVQSLKKSVFSKEVSIILQQCQIRQIPSIQAPISQFSLSGNRINKIGMISKLIKLKIKNNNIQTLPDLSQCRQLTQLDASSNKINDISSFISTISEQLTTLDLSYNSIKQVKAIKSKSKLKQIILTSNQITDISQLCLNLPKGLQILELQENQIKEFPIINAQSLIRLDLSFNKITIVNGGKGTPNLSELLLNRNQIIKIERLVGNYEVLNLEDNYLEEIQFLRSDQIKVQQIKLYNNKIKKLNKIPSNCILLQLGYQNVIQQLTDFLQSDCDGQSLQGSVFFKGNIRKIQQMKTKIENTFYKIQTGSIIQKSSNEEFLDVPKAEKCLQCQKELGDFYYWCYWSKKSNIRADFRCRQCVEALKENKDFKFLQNAILVCKETKQIYKSMIGNNLQPDFSQPQEQLPKPYYFCNICRNSDFQKGVARYIVLDYDQNGEEQHGGVQDLCQPCIDRYIKNENNERSLIYSPHQSFLRILFQPKDYYNY